MSIWTNVNWQGWVQSYGWTAGPEGTGLCVGLARSRGLGGGVQPKCATVMGAKVAGLRRGPKAMDARARGAEPIPANPKAQHPQMDVKSGKAVAQAVSAIAQSALEELEMPADIEGCRGLKGWRAGRVERVAGRGQCAQHGLGDIGRENRHPAIMHEPGLAVRSAAGKASARWARMAGPLVTIMRDAGLAVRSAAGKASARWARMAGRLVTIMRDAGLAVRSAAGRASARWPRMAGRLVTIVPSGWIRTGT